MTAGRGRNRNVCFGPAQPQHNPAITDHEEIAVQRTFATLMTAALLCQSVKAEEAEMQANHPYVGLWVTEDITSAMSSCRMVAISRPAVRVSALRDATK